MRIGIQDLRREQKMGCDGIRSSWTIFESPEQSDNEELNGKHNMQNWTVYHYQNWLSLSGRVEEAGN
jgi:hypothetical protein